MNPETASSALTSRPPTGIVVNDFAIEAATINGTGSQSANNILTRTLFRMGIPVAPKNLFPSNIQGLPTWFSVRVSKDGHVGHRDTDILVGMNPETWEQDVSRLRPGAVVLYDSGQLTAEPLKQRPDLIVYPVPIWELCKKLVTVSKLRKLLANVIYVGALVELLGIDQEILKGVIADTFAKKPKAVDINVKAAQAGIDYVREHLEKKDPYLVEPMARNEGRILIEGNTLCALGSLMAGCTVVGWYPITPSSSICESLIEQFGEFRVDPVTGEHRYAVVQCEDELASIGMVLGAGWAGARAMTATAGPGISLMSEFIGFGYYAEVPAVLFNVQRIGPSTGLPTRTSQGDLLLCAYSSHGDTEQICLIPSSPEECYELSQAAFDVAERFQTPVFVLTDLDLGMNLWMCDRPGYPTKGFDRGKVLSAEDLEGARSFGRYDDVDGDGICYRTLPGNSHLDASYFTRGSGHDERARYTEDGDAYVRNMDRIRKKFDRARGQLPQPIVDCVPDATVGLLAYGSTDAAIEEARGLMEARDLKTSYLRVVSLPLSTKVVADFIRRHERVYVVEQNRDAQMATVIRTDIHEGKLTDRLRSSLQYKGLPISAHKISADILAQEATEAALGEHPASE